MSMTSRQYAALANDVYKEPTATGVDSKAVSIGGTFYKRLEYVDRPSGYQGMLYQRMDTGELTVVHRGTEFDRQPLRDGLVADGGMVATRHNAQVPDAIAFTQHALEYAEQIGKSSKVPPVTVTGHSLGGDLAQVTAHHFGLEGETFNAYGAVSLDRRIPEGGNDVINHVMAGDPVSAASRHYGQVRVYATPQEIATLEHAGYANDRSTFDARNPMSAIGGLVVESHRMHNFLPVDGHGKPDRSVLEDPAALQLAQHDAPMIEKYRGDVALLRTAATLGARGWQGLAADALDELRGPLAPGAGRNAVGVPTWPEHMRQLHDTQQPGAAPQDWRAPLKVAAEGMTAIPGDLPDDPLYRMLRDKLSANIPTATVMHAAVEAKREGMHRPEQIKSVQEHNGSIWIEGTTPGFRVQVETGGAAPALQDSVRQAQALDQQRAQVEPAAQQPAARVH